MRIADTSAGALPAGWGGTGDETDTGEPLLPADRTFTSALAGVDEAVFTTFEPGFFYGFTAFDIRVDNIGIATVGAPTPVPALSDWGALALITCLLAGGAVTLRRRAIA